jgi:hypothetical protein
MLRFTLFIFLLLTLYYALHVLIKDTPSFGRTVKNPALTGGALKTFKTISTACCVHDADT